MTNEIQICFSKWRENEKRNSNPFFKVMRKRKTKTKFISVFQSDAKTKYENWNWYPFFKVMRKQKNEIRSAKPFFKLRRKRKTKSKIQICFLVSCENEKWKWHLNSRFPCHRKTVGTKVLLSLTHLLSLEAASSSFQVILRGVFVFDIWEARGGGSCRKRTPRSNLLKISDTTQIEIAVSSCL